MKKSKLFSALLLTTFIPFGLFACKKNDDQSPKSEDITIKTEEDGIHFLRFKENDAEIMKMVVLEGETYDDLYPYFPILTEDDNFIKYWDGDYNYTDYSKDNQYKVYDPSNSTIDINAIFRKK